MQLMLLLARRLVLRNKKERKGKLKWTVEYAGCSSL